MSPDELVRTAPEVTPSLARAIQQLRAREQRVQELFLSRSSAEREALVRSQVVGDAAAACSPPPDEALDVNQLCEACLEARGPVEGGPRRCMLRERARLHLRLAGRPLVLERPDDLLLLWDEATRREPIIRLFVDEPRWRTGADGVPFTGRLLAPLREPSPLLPGRETADPPDIPALAEEIVGFARRDDLPPEVVALGMSYLLGHVHPFADGNGHTLRMFGYEALHRAGYCEPTLLAFADALRARRKELCELTAQVTLGQRTWADHVAFLLAVLGQAQGEALRLLGQTEAAP